MRWLVLLLFSAFTLSAQRTSTLPSTQSSPWFNAQSLNFAALTLQPPTSGSKADRDDLRQVLVAQHTRSAAQIREAQADAADEDIFLFASLLGPHFNANELPITAALSKRLREASAAVNPGLKLHFARPRPFIASAQVHPVCEKPAGYSFPSGHGMVGTLEALALTQIVPERSPEIFSRLGQYMQNRIVCGVHYPSDEVASKAISSTLFGLLAASPAFQQELKSARAEIRGHLGLAPISSANVSSQEPFVGNTVITARHAEESPYPSVSPD